MTPGAKMMMMRSNRNKRNYGVRNTMNYPMNDNYGVRNNYDMDSRYDMESKFRDRRGREHYDNGRFAPRSEWDAHIVGDEYRDTTRSEYDRDGRRDGRVKTDMRSDYMEPPYMRRVAGFGGDVESNYPTRVDSPMYNEGSSMKGKMENGGGAYSSGKTYFNKATAEKWMHKLKNGDGTTGPHWSMEQVKQLMEQKNLDCDLLELWTTMNMFYSDYYKVAKKLNINNTNFYLDMAMAFLEDDDAVSDKLAAYYENVVKHG